MSDCVREPLVPFRESFSGLTRWETAIIRLLGGLKAATVLNLFCILTVISFSHNTSQ